SAVPGQRPEQLRLADLDISVSVVTSDSRPLSPVSCGNVSVVQLTGKGTRPAPPVAAASATPPAVRSRRGLRGGAAADAGSRACREDRHRIWAGQSLPGEGLWRSSAGPAWRFSW